MNSQLGLRPRDEAVACFVPTATFYFTSSVNLVAALAAAIFAAASQFAQARVPVLLEANRFSHF
jgi:hypothetical protein